MIHTLTSVYILLLLDHIEPSTYLSNTTTYGPKFATEIMDGRTTGTRLKP